VKGSSFKLDIGYWKATDFVNPRGEELFGSVSVVDSSLNQKNRNLITLNFIIRSELQKGLQLNSGLTL